MHLSLHPLLVSLLFFITAITANTEKAIFIAPETAPSASDLTHLSPLLSLPTLTPQNTTWRTHLPSAFPSSNDPHGVSTWVVLGDLEKGQRYEVRICWAATEPTAFQLTTYSLSTVLSTPELLSSLTNSTLPSNAISSDPSSYLTLLRINTAADFFSPDPARMEFAPPVFVDVILDPFFLNLIPESLLSTVGVIIAVAPVAVVLAKRIAAWVTGYAERIPEDEVKKTQ